MQAPRSGGASAPRRRLARTYFGPTPIAPIALTNPAPRDNEFYAWMSGAYMPSVGQFTAYPPSEFHGTKPERSDYEEDWALNGYNWNLEE